ncbi:MAG: response regulator [Sulfuricurvum sp.]|uniref:response regulator transcription factor n=1 Tax=Sulfuricurvum sp. TaxID=2025608 RepID=UPI00260BDFFD|nr:response regulator [Sulfuricurvum sp.]MDD2829736.1 response regulator [Sulfuricurvum sp.]MDD4949206.1 response regulator [Sulfuricurvum sp.]
MISVKDVQKFSKNLKVLYVEDNDVLRKETAALFQPFFASVDLASNGQEGLEKYNHERYDIVISDINMPLMNGIEMIGRMQEINPEQKVIAISAHDESDFLLQIIRRGVSSFILKPINLDEMLRVLYTVSRDADTQNINLELFETLRQERLKLKKMVHALTSHHHTVAIKNEQIEQLYSLNHTEEKSAMLQEYFSKDVDEGEENVLFIHDDSEELLELLNDLPNDLSQYVFDKDIEHIKVVYGYMSKISQILYRYTPFLDPLAQNFEALSAVVAKDDKFSVLLATKSDHILKLFDAVCIDLQLYVKRFSKENMAMKNIHHIHQPTSMSIQQIITLIDPQEDDECGDIEFF